MNYLLLFFSLLFVSNSPTPSQSPDPNYGLVAYYSFDKCDARDDSGNGCEGILYGNPSCWCGIDNNGLLLDGKNDYVEFTGVVNRCFTTSDFTVSFYFKAEKKSIFKQSLLSKRSDCAPEYVFDIQLDQQSQKIQTDVLQEEGINYGEISPDCKEVGWYHYALVREGRHAHTYINGILVHSGTRCSGVDISNDAPLNFSNSPCIGAGGTRRFQGILDELRIFDRALSHEDIQALYDRYPIEQANADCFS